MLRKPRLRRAGQRPAASDARYRIGEQPFANSAANRFIIACTWAIILAMGTGSATAGSTWDGGGGTNTNWGAAANWNNDTLPAFNSGTVLTFGTGGTTATNETTRSAGSINLNRDADFAINGTGTINLYYGVTVDGSQTAGRTFTVQAPITLQSDNTWTVNNGSSGSNTLDIQGSVNGNGKSLSIGGSGTVRINSAAGQLTPVDEYVGRDGAGTLSQSAGTNTVSGYFRVGYDLKSNGVYNLSGTGQLSAGNEYVGLTGTGTFTQTGGTNTVLSSLYIGSGVNSSGTYNLNGGTLSLSSLNKGSGAAAFNFGGGTLQANGLLTTLLPMTLTGVGGNAKVDTMGRTVTLSGALSGTGGLNKLGTGRLTLDAIETYSGDTTVNGGTLEFVKGIAAGGTSLIDVQSGKALVKTVNVSKSNLDVITAPSATFEVVDGTHTVGAISGGGTTLVDSGAGLSVASVSQDVLTVGSGATVTIRAIPGGPLGGAVTPVPEPSAVVLLSTVVLGLLVHVRRGCGGGMAPSGRA
jgi:fibronectin-binding autotransporter adhesin